MRKIKSYFTIVAVMAVTLLSFTSCIEDSVTTSPSDQPEFSTAEIDFGDVFTLTPSPTYSFKVYNRHDKVLSISSIRLKEGEKSAFRMNVDGEAAHSFSNIEIRPNDSIYVFVETTVPSGGHTDFTPFSVEDRIEFITNGVTSGVRLKANACDVEDYKDVTLDADTRWDTHPRRIFGTLTIPQGITLTIGPGVSVYLHDKASIEISGTLITEGVPDTDTASGFVTLRGDRLDTVVGDSPFDLLASQWGGIYVMPGGSLALSHTDVRGMAYGIIAEAADGPAPEVTLHNSRLHRSGANLLTLKDALLTATGCEFSDSKGALMSLSGGVASVAHCSFVNYYISSYDVGPLVLTDWSASEPSTTVATFDNCLLLNYRAARYISPGDLTGSSIKFRSSLIAISGSDDENFVSCIWGETPLTAEDHVNHIYDYRLQAGSPGIDAGDGLLTPTIASTDMYGTPRHSPSPTVGAYEMK